MKNTFKIAIFALALTVTVGASAAFDTNLRFKARGDSVTALQEVLVSGGYLTVAPTGYFGTLTLKAVKDYQRANGITPTGFVGPLTRAALNSTTVTTTPVNTTCPVGMTCTVTPVVGSTSGMEGFGEFRLGTQPVDNTNITTNVDVPVYSVEVKAKNSDVSFERLTLDVSVLATGYENPGTLINKITVRDGSTVLATFPVNSSSFSKYTGTNNYYIQLAGLSSKVLKDTTKTFTVSFDTNYIDTSRTVTVGVAANGIRVVDGRGISTYNASAISSRTHTFKKPGASTLTLQADTVKLYSSNYEVDADEGARNALTSTFALKSTTGPSKITSVSGTTTTVGGDISNIYLYKGDTLLSSRSLVAGTTTFSFDIESNGVTIAKDSTETFSIKVDLAASTTNSTFVTTSVTAVAYEKADGSSATATALITGPTNYFAPIVAKFAKVSSTVETKTNNSIITSIVPTFTMTVQALGGSLDATATATINFIPKNGGTTVSTTTIGTFAGSPTTIGENSVNTLVFSKTVAAAAIAASTDYRITLQGITWKGTGAASTTQSGVFEAFEISSFSY